MNGSSPSSPPPPPGPPSLGAAGPDPIDDAGTRALAEALRSSFVILKVIMLALVVVFLCSGFFTVGTQEKAVILRFGKPVGTDETALLGPGLHWALPYPIDEVVKIPLGQVQIVPSTIGWYASNPALEAAGTEPPARDSLNPAQDGYLLTADENVIHVRGALRYRIAEPGLRYTFGFVNPSNSVREAFNSSLVYAAARYPVDQALTRDTVGFREAVRGRLEQLIGEQDLGIVADQIELQSVPPRFLAKAFDAVSEAEQRRSTVLNQARSGSSEVVSRARSEATARVVAGESQRALLVESVNTEATNFLALLPAYQRDPALFVRQLQTEAMQRILTNAEHKVILPHSARGQPVQLRMQIGRPAPVQAKPVATPKHDDH